MTFRKLLFWLHLLVGSLAGLVIGIMALTGTAIAFEPQVLDSLRKDVRHLRAPADASPLPLEAIIEAAEAHRGSKATALVVHPEEEAAVLVGFGRKDFDFTNPWTGEFIPDPAASWARFFQTTKGVHRWLGASEDNRPSGRSITGASNLGFVGLALTGLYLWMPRRFSWQSLRPIVWFRPKLRGQARDWNFHHTIGFWALPVILVISISGAVISYPWATALIYEATGEEMPKGGKPSPPTIMVSAKEPGLLPLSLDALVLRARAEMPNADELGLELPKEAAEEGNRAAIQVTAREKGAHRPVAISHLSLDPYTGEALHLTRFEDQARAARIRGWLRYLHTGEALGLAGQLVAAMASLGALVLVFTGLALALRRLVRFRRRKEAINKAGAKGMKPVGI